MYNYHLFQRIKRHEQTLYVMGLDSHTFSFTILHNIPVGKLSGLVDEFNTWHENGNYFKKLNKLPNSFSVTPRTWK